MIASAATACKTPYTRSEKAKSPRKQKGRNLVGPTLQQKRKACITGLVDISGPTPAWLPGSPRRDTSCRCRSSAAKTARSAEETFLRHDGALDPPARRAGIDRSLRTPRSRSCPLAILLPIGPQLMVRPTRSLVVTNIDICGCPGECNMIKMKSHVARFRGISELAPCEATGS